MEHEALIATADLLAAFAATAEEQRSEIFAMDAHPLTLREAAELHQALEKVRIGLMEVSQIARDLRLRASKMAQEAVTAS